MRIQAREFLFKATLTMLMTAGLVAWPAAAAAAGQADPGTGEEARVEQTAHPPIEWSEPKPSPISLRLFGGFNRAAAGDLNDVLDSYFELLELYSAVGGGAITGGYNPLRDGYNAGADLVVQITPHVGIGIGAGYMRFSESSRLTWSFHDDDFTLSSVPTLSAIPVRLGVFLTLPLGERFRLTAGAAAVAFPELRLDMEQQLDLSGSDGLTETMHLSARRASPFGDLGYEGRLGFELDISRNTGFFVEALGRYAHLGNFDEATLIRTGAGTSSTVEGRIYFMTYTMPEKYSMFTVLEEPPGPDSPAKEPMIDLSGVSLQAGFRIRL